MLGYVELKKRSSDVTWSSMLIISNIHSTLFWSVTPDTQQNQDSACIVRHNRDAIVPKPEAPLLHGYRCYANEDWGSLSLSLALSLFVSFSFSQDKLRSTLYSSTLLLYVGPNSHWHCCCFSASERVFMSVSDVLQNFVSCANGGVGIFFFLSLIFPREEGGMIILWVLLSEEQALYKVKAFFDSLPSRCCVVFFFLFFFIINCSFY